MSACIALLRGINVGRARRLAMADLRRLLEGLGYTHVRTVLNSGNAVFEAGAAGTGQVAAAIGAALQAAFGWTVPVMVVTADELEAIVAANPLAGVATDPSKHLVAFVAQAAVLAQARALAATSWAPEALALGARAAYLWCGQGITASRLLPAFAQLAGDAATTRNWATVLRLQALASGRAPAP